jgi:hypothetical protein
MNPLQTIDLSTNKNKPTRVVIQKEGNVFLFTLQEPNKDSSGVVLYSELAPPSQRFKGASEAFTAAINAARIFLRITGNDIVVVNNSHGVELLSEQEQRQVLSALSLTGIEVIAK